MGRFDHASNTINLITTTKYTAFGVIENCVFVKDLVDCSATTYGIIFSKYVAQITKQQGRYAVRHELCPLYGIGLRCLDARIEGKLQQTRCADCSNHRLSKRLLFILVLVKIQFRLPDLRGSWFGSTYSVEDGPKPVI